MKDTLAKGTLLVVLAASLIAGCAPAPTPAPVVQPTPQVVEKRVEVRVEVTPQVCRDAIDGLVEALDSENDLLGFYFNGEQPSDAAVERFLAQDPEAIFDLMSKCMATPSGEVS